MEFADAEQCEPAVTLGKNRQSESRTDTDKILEVVDADVFDLPDKFAVGLQQPRRGGNPLLQAGSRLDSGSDQRRRSLADNESIVIGRTAPTSTEIARRRAPISATTDEVRLTTSIPVPAGSDASTTRWRTRWMRVWVLPVLGPAVTTAARALREPHNRSLSGKEDRGWLTIPQILEVANAKLSPNWAHVSATLTISQRGSPPVHRAAQTTPDHLSNHTRTVRATRHVDGIRPSVGVHREHAVAGQRTTFPQSN